jgi:hypothetical protein
MNSNRPTTPSNPEFRGCSKKPYVKPSFRFEQTFETMALACGKIKTTQGQCKSNQKNS